MGASVAVISAWLAGGAVARQKPASAPGAAGVEPLGSAAPAEPTAPPKLDIGRAIAEAVARILATPRFEEQVEVRDTYQEALGRYFVAAELSCGTTESGPPQQDELKKPRFFLYCVHLKAAPERFVYVVREGTISENDRATVPGTEWELLAGFVDAAKAADALSKLQRGASTPSSPEQTRGLSLWAARKCSG